MCWLGWLVWLQGRLSPSDIERSAAKIFPSDVLPPEMRTGTVPLEQLEAAYVEKRLWTVLTKAGSPVGFAIALRKSGSAFLQEVSVHPVHQQKGLGRQLVLRAISWAEKHEYSCVTLTTFEHIPWNAPFYLRLGFRKLTEQELSCELLSQLQNEYRLGLRHRVAMQFDLAEHSSSTLQLL